MFYYLSLPFVSLLDFFDRGGPVIFILFVVAIIMITLLVERLIFFLNDLKKLSADRVLEVKECSYDNETYVHMRAKLCASIIKQFVKKNFPNLKVWAGSDVYSGGSSVRVEVSNADGSKVDSSIFTYSSTS